MTPIDDQGDRGRDDQGDNSIKPWSCAHAHFRVQTPGKGEKNRRSKLRKMKRIAKEGLNSLPYVKVDWKYGVNDYEFYQKH